MTVRENAARHRYNVRLAALVAYSSNPPRCACCQEWRLEFLTVDHVDGRGSSDRRANSENGGHRTYIRLKKAGFPPGFRVLCWNCNVAHGLYGRCPHADSDRVAQELTPLRGVPMKGRRMPETHRANSSRAKLELWSALRGFAPVTGPELEAAIAASSIVAVAAQYNVSRPTIRRWRKMSPATRLPATG